MNLFACLWARKLLGKKLRIHDLETDFARVLVTQLKGLVEHKRPVHLSCHSLQDLPAMVPRIDSRIEAATSVGQWPIQYTVSHRPNFCIYIYILSLSFPQNKKSPLLII